MTTRRPQPGEPQPGPLSEELLLGLIEGELDEAAESRVLAALASRPDLLASVRMMRRQKSLLSELCDVQAPASVVEGIQGAVERAALLDERTSFEELPPAPISLKIGSHKSRTSRVLAAAAALALVAGGSGYLLYSRSAPAPRLQDKQSLVAKKDSAPRVDAAPFERSLKEIDTAPEAPRPAPPAVIEDPSAGSATLAAREIKPAADEAPTVRSGAEPVEAPRTRVVSVERALELAAQGRLAVRIRADALGRAVTAMDSIASRPGASWYLSSPNPGGQAGAEAGVSDLARRDAARATFEARQRAVAADSGIGALRTIEGMSERQPVLESHPYFASLALTTESLNSLRRTIEDKTDSSVTFEELSGPAQPDVEIKDSEPLWWDDPPSRWVPWGDVLVVVEG